MPHGLESAVRPTKRSHGVSSPHVFPNPAVDAPVSSSLGTYERRRRQVRRPSLASIVAQSVGGDVIRLDVGGPTACSADASGLRGNEHAPVAGLEIPRPMRIPSGPVNVDASSLMSQPSDARKMLPTAHRRTTSASRRGAVARGDARLPRLGNILDHALNSGSACPSVSHREERASAGLTIDQDSAHQRRHAAGTTQDVDVRAPGAFWNSESTTQTGFTADGACFDQQPSRRPESVDRSPLCSETHVLSREEELITRSYTSQRGVPGFSAADTSAANMRQGVPVATSRGSANRQSSAGTSGARPRGSRRGPSVTVVGTRTTADRREGVSGSRSRAGPPTEYK